MRAEDFLREPEQIEKRCWELIHRIEELQQLPRMDYTEPKIQHSGRRDYVADRAEKLIELRDELDRLISRRDYLKFTLIPKMLDQIPNQDHRLAVQAYNTTGTYQKAGEILGKNQMTARRWRMEGLKALQEILDKTTDNERNRTDAN